ncbi:hypothetical protein PPL_05109 [Heterostelium album PN500]|uniref:NAD-dependent epimerase/dehydratase domain-containing protein n=1 Tax=Heterostelium pallidum (strain ATCC 26659 / Pp 5 / PN500) TaxID=670386 RepID=D3B9G5_HETP5|nr:hypothetical protein PPL_05109 [Heterostelium album PN500]EFA81877.1 hypothetical protein PPL_05109 [Heterostelium album PN500]|eukprot:XP_020433994.1 hypothetical protein PPL_05109 [Heterostelium album PN500]
MIRFKVYGLARTQEKADYLTKNEINPIIGNASDVEVWGAVAERVDVVVEALADYTNRATTGIVLAKIQEVATKKPHLTIIYTSGSLVYEETQDLVDENSPYNVTHPFFSHRRKVEEQYQAFGGIIIQPSYVYGGQGSASSYYFRLATQTTDGQVTMFGKNKDQYRSFIHGADLAQIYLLAALNASSVRGQIFIGSANYFKSEEVVRAIAKEAGVEIKTINYISPPDDDIMAQVYSVSSRATSKKAELLLGWKANRPSLIDNTKHYLQTWKLYQQPSTPSSK